MTNQKLPLVSVVMCVYNGERFLPEQLDSVLAQTYENLELLVLDDRSTDASLILLEAYAERHANIRLVQNETNIGFNRNFEKGISLAQGDFISICDQDDIWLPTKIEELVTHIGTADLIYSNSELMDDNGNSLNRTLEYRLVHVDNPDYKAFLGSNFITGHTCLFKKSLVRYALPLPDSVTYYDKWIGMIASYVGQVKYYPKILTRYRVHEKSVIQQYKLTAECRKQKRLKEYAEVMAFINLDFVKEDDKDFMRAFLKLKGNAQLGGLHYLNCFFYLLRNHASLYPWYSKSFVKKINFLRKQCL